MVGEGRRSVVRVGLVGYGYWGSKHARVLSGLPGVQLTIIEEDAVRRRSAEASFPTALVAGSLRDVHNGLDAVVIATPPRTHATLAEEALEYGLHVLVEKPLATSVDDAEKMVDAATKSDRILMVGHTYEYNAGVLKLKEIIDSGELGRILYIDTARLNLGLYQSDCNVIWDLVPHDISIVSYLLDEFPDTVSVWAHRNMAGMQEDIAHVRLGFPSTFAFIHVSWLHPSKVRTVTVVGDRKMAVYDDLSDIDRIRIYDKSIGLPVGDSPTPSMPITYRTGNIVSPYVEVQEPLAVQDSHFIECVRSGQHPRTPGLRGLEVVRVLSASDDAITTGLTVQIQRSGAESSQEIP